MKSEKRDLRAAADELGCYTALTHPSHMNEQAGQKRGLGQTSRIQPRDSTSSCSPLLNSPPPPPTASPPYQPCQESWKLALSAGQVFQKRQENDVLKADYQRMSLDAGSPLQNVAPAVVSGFFFQQSLDPNHGRDAFRPFFVVRATF